MVVDVAVDVGAAVVSTGQIEEAGPEEGVVTEEKVQLL